MRRMSRAAWGSVLFFLVAPGVMGGVVPWLLSAGYDDPAASSYVTLGLVLVVLGVVVLVACFVQFVREGRGTPAPVAPTQDEAYRAAVPGWWPRLTPWRGPDGPASSR